MISELKTDRYPSPHLPVRALSLSSVQDKRLEKKLSRRDSFLARSACEKVAGQRPEEEFYMTSISRTVRIHAGSTRSSEHVAGTIEAPGRPFVSVGRFAIG